MAKALSRWEVSPHGPLTQLEPNLWWVEQPLPSTPLHRVMTVARRDDGRLVIHNAVALEEAAMRTLEAAGEPAFLVVPSGFHRRDARIFKDRYPQVKVVAPRGSQAKVAEVVPVDLGYEQVPADASVRFETLDGTGEKEGAVIVSSPGATSVVLNDALFNMPHAPGLSGLVLRLAGSSGGPRLSLIDRLVIIKDRPAFRAHLERLAALPDLRRVIVAHHEIIDRDPAATLRQVAATL